MECIDQKYQIFQLLNQLLRILELSKCNISNAEMNSNIKKLTQLQQRYKEFIKTDSYEKLNKNEITSINQNEETIPKIQRKDATVSNTCLSS